MNAPPEINGPPPEGDAIRSLLPEADKPSRPHDKIAQLPKVLRDRINAMLDDGLPYRRIVEELQKSTEPVLPYPISVMNISRWKDRGYQNYLAQQERLAFVRLNREDARELVGNDDTTTLPEGALQIIASHYYEVLGGFSATSLQQKLGEDPLKYTRFVNAFARLTREIVNLKKQREAALKEKVTELKKLDPHREFTDREHEIFADRMDEFFLKRRRKRKTEETGNQ